MEVSMNSIILWHVTACSLVEVYHRLRGISCPHLQALKSKPIKQPAELGLLRLLFNAEEGGGAVCCSEMSVNYQTAQHHIPEDCTPE
jgi:hypothetical protein